MEDGSISSILYRILEMYTVTDGVHAMTGSCTRNCGVPEFIGSIEYYCGVTVGMRGSWKCFVSLKSAKSTEICPPPAESVRTSCSI